MVLEPAAALPVAGASAAAGGVVALRVPVAGQVVVDFVLAFVEAWQRESLEALVALLTTDAGPFDARGRGSRVLVDGWRQRLRAHGYGRLAGVEVVHPERVERWERDELGGPGMPARPADMRPGEILVRIPVETPSVAGERLFGDELLMILRPDDGKLKIAAYGEVEGR